MRSARLPVLCRWIQVYNTSRNTRFWKIFDGVRNTFLFGSIFLFLLLHLLLLLFHHRHRYRVSHPSLFNVPSLHSTRRRCRRHESKNLFYYKMLSPLSIPFSFYHFTIFYRMKNLTPFFLFIFSPSLLFIRACLDERNTFFTRTRSLNGTNPKRGRKLRAYGR